MHRRPPAVRTPAELVMFSEEDWPGPEGFVPGSNNLDEASWDSPFQRWKNARRAYAAEHPDSELGSVLDQLRFERWTRRSRAGWPLP
jgi:hypothetical protein